MMEKQIDAAVTRYARDHGILSVKLTSYGSWGVAGWPDRLYLYRGHVLFVEMKAEKKQVTPLQKQIHEELKLAGFKVFVCDNIPEGKRIIDYWIIACDTNPMNINASP
jgi:hypothetical protein